MLSVVVSTADPDHYAMQDMHGHHVCHVDRAEAQRLLKLGFAHSYGTKKKIHGIRLTVSLAKATGAPEKARSHHISNLGGTRYVYREKVSTERVNAYLFRFKKMHLAESPEHALLRILTAPALESVAYTPRHLATEAERAADPGKARRQQARDLFSFTYRRRAAA